MRTKGLKGSEAEKEGQTRLDEEDMREGEEMRAADDENEMDEDEEAVDEGVNAELEEEGG